MLFLVVHGTRKVWSVERDTVDLHKARWLRFSWLDVKAAHNGRPVDYGLPIRLQEGCLRWQVLQSGTRHDGRARDQGVLLVGKSLSLIIKLGELARDDRSTFTLLLEPGVLEGLLRRDTLIWVLNE